MKTKYVLFDTNLLDECGVANIEPSTAEIENKKLSANCQTIRWMLPEEIEGMRAFNNEVDRNQNPYWDRAASIGKDPKANAWDQGWLLGRNLSKHKPHEYQPGPCQGHCKLCDYPRVDEIHLV